MRALAVAVTAALLAAPAAPPRFRAGTLPPLPDAAVGAGEVLLEVSVDANGSVIATRALRDAPPYTEPLRTAVASWAFVPARDAAGRAVPSLILVGASYRPTTLVGPGPGDAPKDVAAPAGGLMFPASTAPAPYPPLARGDGQVLVEIEVAPDGTTTARVARSGPGFDDAALQAARSWRFRPSAGGGRAYVIFAFRGISG